MVSKLSDIGDPFRGRFELNKGFRFFQKMSTTLAEIQQKQPKRCLVSVQSVDLRKNF